MIGASLRCVAAIAWLAAGVAGAGEVRVVDVGGYEVRTDLPAEDGREVEVRLGAIAGEYASRLKAFGVDGVGEGRMPAYVYRDAADYEAAGGTGASAGVFDGKRLLVYAGGARANARTWNTLQHEALHQWVRGGGRGRRLPMWVEEGLGEYFGEAIWCGDEFVYDVVPGWRAKRVKEWLARQERASVLARLSRVSEVEWNRRIAIEDYDAAWSVVQYLLAGEQGRHRGAFEKYVAAVVGGGDAERAWGEKLPRMDEVERGWRKYVESLPAEDARDLYARAACSILNSFLARGVAAGQQFGTWEEFRDAAKIGWVPVREEDWLPPALLKEGVALAEEQGRWELYGGNELRVTLEGGRRFVGRTSDGVRRPKAIATQP